MQSVWSATAGLPRFPALQGPVKTDVLVIGGGMAGLLCAYLLRQNGVSCVLAEGKTICSGITQNTTAKVTAQHGLIYDKLLQSAGSEKARQYLCANQRALEEIRALCVQAGCDFEQKSAFVYSINDRKKLERELRALERLGYRARFAERLPLPFETAGAVEFPKQAQFHPLKFAAHIAGGLTIYENTFVKRIEGRKAVTDHGEILAEKIIVATHFPFLNKHGSYFLKLYQHRSYVLALKNAPDVNGMYVDEAEKGLSFRNWDGLLLLGGGSHRTGKSGGNWRELRAFAAERYPHAEESYAWATQDCMSLDGIPYIGPYSKSTPGLYVASGFNKWGMTSSMAAAMILSDMVSGRSNDCAAVFSPQRSILKPQLAVNGFEAVVHLLTPARRRCPHLGCALKWNPAEHSWDCPCHGSRFAEDGALLNNPATGPADVQK